MKLVEDRNEGRNHQYGVGLGGGLKVLLRRLFLSLNLPLNNVYFVIIDFDDYRTCWPLPLPRERLLRESPREKSSRAEFRAEAMLEGPLDSARFGLAQ